MIGAVAVILFLSGAILVFWKSKAIDTGNVEADAVVSRISETFDDERSSSSKAIYVKYTDENETERVSAHDNS